MSLPMKVPTPTPPLKGSFPLDHEGQCRYEMLKYMLCLNEHKQKIDECRDFAQLYLKCRMDNGLMQQEEWKYLGFPDKNETNSDSLKVALSNQDLTVLRADVSAKLANVTVEAAIEKARKAT